MTSIAFVKPEDTENLLSFLIDAFDGSSAEFWRDCFLTALSGSHFQGSCFTGDS
jgi:hypothetical protein